MVLTEAQQVKKNMLKRILGYMSDNALMAMGAAVFSFGVRATFGLAQGTNKEILPGIKTNVYKTPPVIRNNYIKNVLGNSMKGAAGVGAIIFIWLCISSYIKHSKSEEKMVVKLSKFDRMLKSKIKDKKTQKRYVSIHKLISKKRMILTKRILKGA